MIATGYAAQNGFYVPSKVTAVLKFSNVKKGHTYTIKDHKGNIVYSKVIEKGGTYAKKFDFTRLKDGSYTFEVNKDFEITITPFEISLQRVRFFNDQMTKIFKPNVRVEQDILMISQLSLNSVPMHYELFFEDDLIYTGTLEGQQVLNGLLKLSKHEKGTYNLKMKSGDQYYYRTFKF